jgi:hypothetical protein
MLYGPQFHAETINIAIEKVRTVRAAKIIHTPPGRPCTQ